MKTKIFLISAICLMVAMAISAQSPTQQVTALEYYIDNEPGGVSGGVGHGTPIPITGGASADVIQTSPINLSSQSPGLHNLYIRAMDEHGRWGIAERRLFYVQPLTNTQTVVALEYYFDNDIDGVGHGTPLPFTPSADTTVTVSFLMPNIPAGASKLYVRAMDEYGRWSISERALDTIATGVAPSVVSPAGPVTFCEGGSVVLSTAAGPGIVLQWFKDGVSLTDSTSATLTVSATGNYRVQATGSGGSSFSNIVAVTSKVPPVITSCNPPVTANTQPDQCSAVVNYATNPVVTGTGPFTFTYSPVSGSSFPVGTTTVNVTVSNGCTPSPACSFSVTVVDNQNPILVNCPADITQCNSIVTWTQPTATDNCTASVTSNYHPGDSFPLGTTTVTDTATDASNNKNTCSFTVTILTPSVANAGPDQSLCSPLSVSLAGNTPSVGTGTWSVISGSGTFNNANNPSAQVTSLSTGTNVFRWTIISGDCISSDDVTIINNSQLTPANAGIDQIIPCSTTYASLNGNNPIAGSGHWTVVSGSGTFSNSSFPASIVFDMAQGVNIYRWTITSGNCSISDDVTITRTITTANAGADQTIPCSTTVATLAGNNPVVGSGFWSVVSGSGTFLFANLNATAVTGIGQGANIYRWTITSGNCTSFDDVTINRTITTADAGPDQTIPCSTSFATLAGNSPTIGTGLWTVVSGSGTFSIPSFPTSIVTNMAQGVNVYRWTITSGNCSTSDDVTITTTPIPPPTITATGSTSMCPGESVTLTSSAADTYLWNTGATTQSVSVNIAGNYTVAASTAACNGTSVPTAVTVYSSPISYSIEWQKSLGGSNDDQATHILQTTDGGYIVAGTSLSTNGDVTGNQGSVDYWIVKLNNTGTLQWQKSLGGSGADYANSIQQTADGGYIVAGQSYSNDGDVTGNHGSYDYWVVKLDNTGNLQWQKSLGGSGLDAANSIQQTTDGGYIVAGFSDSNDGDLTRNHGSYDYWVVKLDNTGNLQWQKSLGGLSDETAHSIQQTADGGYIVAGESYSNDGDVTGNHGSYDYWVVKLDNTGTLQWQKSLGGSGEDRAKSIQQTTDGGYIVAGYSYSTNGDVTGNHGSFDYWIAKISSTGTLQWEKSLGGSEVDVAKSIQQTTDGGYIVAGISTSTNGDVTGNHGSSGDYWVVKLDNIGNLRWEKSLGGTGADYANSIQQTADGSYIVAGFSGSNDRDITGNHGSNDLWVAKLAPKAFIYHVGPITFCQGTSQELTATAGTNYLWSTGAVTPSITVSASGSYSVTVDHCYVSAPVIVTVTPTTLPQAGPVTGPALVCGGGTFQYTVPAVPGAVSYVWNLPVGMTYVNDGLGPNFTDGISGNTITVLVAGGTSSVSPLNVHALNGCGSGPFSANFNVARATVVPATPGAIAGTNPICVGSGYTYAISAVANAVSYTWAVPPTALMESAQGTTHMDIKFVTNSANYVITVTAVNCKGTSSKTLTVTKVPVPATPGAITGTSPVCVGDTPTYSIAAVANAISYTWAAPANSTIVSGQGNTSIRLAIGNGYNTANLSVTSVGCNGNNGVPRTLSVVKLAVPATPGAITGPISVCPDNATVYTYSITPIAGLTYTWTPPSGATLTSPQGTNLVTLKYGGTYSTGALSVVANNCSGSSLVPKTLTVNKIPIPVKPGAITGTKTICWLSTYIYTITAVTNATSYSWTVPPLDSIISGQGTTSITVQYKTNFSSGTLSVSAVDCSGGGTAQTLAITHATNCGIGRMLHDTTTTTESAPEIIPPVNPEFNVTLFPNPFSTQFHLKIESPNDEIVWIKISNINGQIIDERKTTETDIDITLDSKLPDGMYLVDIQQGDNRKILRVVKMD